MDQSEFYIHKKEVDWSVLHEGFSIPVIIQVLFHQKINKYLKRGEKKEIIFLLNNIEYKVKLTNLLFNEKKYPNHKDIIQIRYSPNSDFSKKLREIFINSYNYLKMIRNNINNVKKQLISVPDDKKEFLILYSTDFDNTFSLDYITYNDFQEMFSFIQEKRISEEDFEISLDCKKVDNFAEIKEYKKILKVRKLDKSIGDNLKILYKYNCQICGNNFGELYNSKIVESHHIIPFVLSLNNNSDNILIICPNHHRVIHKTNPIFDRDNKIFMYPNGIKEPLKLNQHL